MAQQLPDTTPPDQRHAVMVGPIRGTVKLKDGTVVDVRPEVVYMDSHEACLEVADLVGRRYAKEGHPNHDPDQPFKYAGLSRKEDEKD